MKKVFLFIFLLGISTITLGLGYAAVSNITLDLSGNSNVKKIDYIKITSIEYKSDLLADLEESKINNYYYTMVNSKIVLGNDINSFISYDVTVRNDTDRSFKYVGAVHENLSQFYDNENIKYDISGIEADEVISPNSEKEITLTYSYLNQPIENTILNSYINIKFSKIFNIEYVNIDSNNLINTIGENESVNIEFSNAPANINVVGDLTYSYDNGILSISSVVSDIKIIGTE